MQLSRYGQGEPRGPDTARAMPASNQGDLRDPRHGASA